VADGTDVLPVGDGDWYERSAVWSSGSGRGFHLELCVSCNQENGEEIWSTDKALATHDSKRTLLEAGSEMLSGVITAPDAMVPVPDIMGTPAGTVWTAGPCVSSVSSSTSLEAEL
jgi:hypothetical protein